MEAEELGLEPGSLMHDVGDPISVGTAAPKTLPFDTAIRLPITLCGYLIKVFILGLPDYYHFDSRDHFISFVFSVKWPGLLILRSLLCYKYLFF